MAPPFMEGGASLSKKPFGLFRQFVQSVDKTIFIAEDVGAKEALFSTR